MGLVVVLPSQLCEQLCHQRSCHSLVTPRAFADCSGKSTFRGRKHQCGSQPSPGTEADVGAGSPVPSLTGVETKAQREAGVQGSAYPRLTTLAVRRLSAVTQAVLWQSSELYRQPTTCHVSSGSGTWMARSHPRFRFSGLGWSLGFCTFSKVSWGIQIRARFRCCCEVPAASVCKWQWNERKRVHSGE